MALLAVSFGGADPAASTSYGALILEGIPDATDISQVVFPFPVEIVGMQLSANPASGDTVGIQANVGGTGTGATLTAAHASAENDSCLWFARGQGTKVAAGTKIGCNYITTTGGTYTVKDVLAKFFVATPDGI